MKKKEKAKITAAAVLTNKAKRNSFFVVGPVGTYTILAHICLFPNVLFRALSIFYASRKFTPCRCVRGCAGVRACVLDLTRYSLVLFIFVCMLFFHLLFALSGIGMDGYHSSTHFCMFASLTNNRTTVQLHSAFRNSFSDRNQFLTFLFFFFFCINACTC